MPSYAFINGELTIFKDDGTYVQCTSEHPEYSGILECVKFLDWEQAFELYEQSYANKINMMYEEDGVYFDEDLNKLFINGVEQHTYISQKVIEHARAKLPFENLLRFIEELEKNISKNSRDELFKYLESRHMPITEDGCFIGYKSVRANFTDWHEGKFDNRVGKTVSVPRRDVDDNCYNSCSHGLHVGNYSYALNFMNTPDRQFILVKINPKDVVSVPVYDCNKLRCCEYKVIGLVKEELKKNVYNENLESLDSDDDYDWEEDEYWEEN